MYDFMSWQLLKIIIKYTGSLVKILKLIVVQKLSKIDFLLDLKTKL